MVKVEFPDGKVCYMDNRLYRNLQILKARFKKDEDFVCCVDGKEGVGKSVFAQQVARTVDPSFSVERMCTTTEKFEYWLRHAPKGAAVVFDEAYRGLGSDKAGERVSKLLTQTMMEMRQQNLFVIIVLPTFFKLNMYAAVFRTRGLFHVYRDKEGNRGRWMYFNEDKKKLLYMYGKKFMSYSGKYIPKSSFKGRFYEQYVIDEVAYREEKKETFKQTEDVDSKRALANKYVKQRNLILKQIMKEFKLTQKETSEFCRRAGVVLSREAVRDAFGKESPPHGFVNADE